MNRKQILSALIISLLLSGCFGPRRTPEQQAKYNQTQAKYPRWSGVDEYSAYTGHLTYNILNNVTYPVVKITSVNPQNGSLVIELRHYIEKRSWKSDSHRASYGESITRYGDLNLNRQNTAITLSFLDSNDGEFMVTKGSISSIKDGVIIVSLPSDLPELAERVKVNLKFDDDLKQDSSDFITHIHY